MEAEENFAEDAAGEGVESEPLPEVSEVNLDEPQTARVAESSDLPAIPGQERRSRRRRRRRRRGGQRGPDTPRAVTSNDLDGQAESKDPSAEHGPADSGNPDDSNEV